VVALADRQATGELAAVARPVLALVEALPVLRRRLRPHFLRGRALAVR
jgi:hypothetical protein